MGFSGKPDTGSSSPSLCEMAKARNNMSKRRVQKTSGKFPTLLAAHWVDKVMINPIV